MKTVEATLAPLQKVHLRYNMPSDNYCGYRRASMAVFRRMKFLALR